MDENPREISRYGIVYAVSVRGKKLKTDQVYFANAVDAYPRYDSKSQAISAVEIWARQYWQGTKSPYISETLVEGEAVIKGLANYFKAGDRIEITVEGIKDDFEGEPVPKGSKGVIYRYDENNDELPFSVMLADDRTISLPPGTFKRANVNSAKPKRAKLN